MLLTSLFPARLLAQAGSTGTLAGHVRGPDGVSVPGATVVLTNPQSGERKETWADEAGNYVFNGLAPGSYKLEVSLLGFQTDVREPIPVTEGKNLKVNVALTISAAGISRQRVRCHSILRTAAAAEPPEPSGTIASGNGSPGAGIGADGR